MQPPPSPQIIPKFSARVPKGTAAPPRAASARVLTDFSLLLCFSFLLLGCCCGCRFKWSKGSRDRLPREAEEWNFPSFLQLQLLTSTSLIPRSLPILFPFFGQTPPHHAPRRRSKTMDNIHLSPAHPQFELRTAERSRPFGKGGITEPPAIVKQRRIALGRDCGLPGGQPLPCPTEKQNPISRETGFVV